MAHPAINKEKIREGHRPPLSSVRVHIRTYKVIEIPPFVWLTVKPFGNLVVNSECERLLCALTACTILSTLALALFYFLAHGFIMFS